MTLTDGERSALLWLARETISAHLGGRALPSLVATGGLDRQSGAFVTLRARQTLRGCIGRIEEDQPLVEVVARCAVAAATSDPRFPPLRARDLALIALEISVLGPVEPVHDVEAIEVGRHGLIVQQGWRRGLLLPQVAIELAWDRPTFLVQTCLKAGLSGDAWQRDAQLFRFEAEVFGESGEPEPA